MYCELMFIDRTHNLKAYDYGNNLGRIGDQTPLFTYSSSI